MTQFEIFKNMTLEELAECLDINGQFEGSPWMTWFNNKYCENCESIKCRYPDGTHEFNVSYCEWESKCKYFPDYEGLLTNRDIIELWLREEA